MTTKANITIDEALLSAVDAYATKHHLSRSATLSLAAAKFLEAEEKAPVMRSTLADMFSLFGDVVKGNLSQAEASARLDALESDYNFLRK